MSEPALYGRDLWGDPIEPPKRGKIADDFTVPPFSVLNAREGFWQDRKRAWLAMGIKSELGRGANTLSLSAKCEDYRTSQKDYNKSSPGGSALPAANYANRERGSGSGSAITGTAAGGGPGTLGKTYNSGGPGTEQENASGTSIFDPVLTELAYRWFCPPAGKILDPFAGGSVRGIVASLLGFRYFGIDLRPEQIESNQAQAKEICEGIAPEWIVGDSLNLDTINPPPADFLFSCPPYGDLERYSDDPRDLSAQQHDVFLTSYRAIIAKACDRLRQNRFACFVVGDFRDKKGNYRNFVGETIMAFLAAGTKLYNEAILVTAVGSLPIRIDKQFRSGRKLGKTHQNVLVFVKGDGRAAADACGSLSNLGG